MISHAVAFFNTHPQPFYGCEVALALLVSAFSKSDVLIKTALILLGAWVGCNVIEAAVGYDAAPLFLPMMDASLCLATLLVSVRTRNVVGLTISALYWVAIVVWAVAIYTHTQSSPKWYSTTNGVFLVQGLIAGVTGGGLAILARSRHRRDLQLGAPVRGL